VILAGGSGWQACAQTIQQRLNRLWKIRPAKDNSSVSLLEEFLRLRPRVVIHHRTVGKGQGLRKMKETSWISSMDIIVGHKMTALRRALTNALHGEFGGVKVDIHKDGKPLNYCAFAITIGTGDDR
jgi:hypothetical protein